jgi:hypothetical protein
VQIRYTINTNLSILRCNLKIVTKSVYQLREREREGENLSAPAVRFAAPMNENEIEMRFRVRQNAARC